MSVMPGDGLRERNKARASEEIAAAALNLFEHAGYDATTCEDIAAAARVSPRTFFRYFPTKADVLFAGRSEETGPMAALAEVSNRPYDEDAIDVVRHALAHPVNALEERRQLVSRQFKILMHTPTLQELQRESFHKFEDPFAQALATRWGLDPSDIGIRLLAASATSALRLSIERWVTADADAGALQPLLDEALNVLRDGLGTHINTKR